MNFSQVSRYLDDALIFGIKPSLIRINKVLKLMGDPHKEKDFIHIVGTNGKTSTTVMLAEILKGQGLRSAYYISPHITSYAERIWIDGSDMTEDKFADTFNEIYPYITRVNSLDLGGPITQFEIITVMAFVAAKNSGTEVMVLEAGMGGRWDATNAAYAKVAGLTGVSLEHTDILGNTISEIASEKVEVIKEGARAAAISTDPEVISILKQKTSKIGAGLYLYSRDFDISSRESKGLSGWKIGVNGIYGKYSGVEIPLIGEYQPLNLSLAIVLAELYMDTKGRRLDAGPLNRSLAGIYVKGRLEMIRKDPVVFSDVSHNPEGMDKFSHVMDKYFKTRKKTIIFAVLADKDYGAMIEKVLEIADRLILTSSHTKRSLSVERLHEKTVEIMEKNSDSTRMPDEVYAIDNVENSLNYALKISCTNDIICITGSPTNLANLG
ncbi:MAG: Mur ligase family protein [Actinobacteria bacterium]|nr:Mur ligase family protein [Actinomycetota bacterium]